MHIKVPAPRWLALAGCWGLVAMLAIETVANEKTETQPPAATADQVARLIEQLGDNDYFVRERAQKELEQIGIEAFDALCAAERHPDIEIAHRASYLVRLIRVEWVQESDLPEVRRILEHYEILDDDQRRVRIKQLAELPDDRGLLALCRLVRFEKSQVLSKLAALSVIEQTTLDETWPARARRIQQALSQSPRVAADWLRAYLNARDNAEAAATTWGKLAEVEATALSNNPQSTSAELVRGLYRQQVALLRELDRRDEAVAVMMKMVDLERNNSDTLVELLTWLTEQEAWPVIDQVAQRFANRFQDDPLFLYTLAQAREAQGDSASARSAVERALSLNPGDQVPHYLVALALQRRGLFEWAEGEFRTVIEIGPPGQPNTLYAQFLLAEMLHDQGHDDRAAQVLEEATVAMEANANQGRQFTDSVRTIKQNRARAHYFRACHLREQNERDEQVDNLWKAIELDPLEADVLIALYRVPDLPAADRDRVRKKIRDAAEVFRRRIQESPEEDMHYNQLAWLIGNTEGDYHEALRCSLKSLELKPGSAGHLDTLARCYFALGDYENALKNQKHAVELDPHSGLMNRQLAEFRAAYERQKAQQQVP